MVKRRGLGRGLGVNALIPEVVPEETILKPSATLSVNEIEPNREQPRKNFDKDKLEALAESIKLHGIVQHVDNNLRQTVLLCMDATNGQSGCKH